MRAIMLDCGSSLTEKAVDAFENSKAFWVDNMRYKILSMRLVGLTKVKVELGIWNG